MAGGSGYAGKPRPAMISQNDGFAETLSIAVCPLTSEPCRRFRSAGAVPLHQCATDAGRARCQHLPGGAASRCPLLMACTLDTSLLVPHFIREPGTARAQAVLAANAAEVLLISPLDRHRVFLRSRPQGADGHEQPNSLAIRRQPQPAAASRRMASRPSGLCTAICRTSGSRDGTPPHPLPS